MNTIETRPHTLQYVIDNLPWLLLCPAGLLYGGMDDMPLTKVVTIVSGIFALVLLYQFIYMRRIIYRISGEQFIYKHGIFQRRTEYLELYRVIDFNEHQTLMQQLFGLKTISIHSGDRTTPVMSLTGIKANQDLVAEIRRRVHLNKQRNGIYEITNR